MRNNNKLKQIMLQIVRLIPFDSRMPIDAGSFALRDKLIHDIEVVYGSDLDSNQPSESGEAASQKTEANSFGEAASIKEEEESTAPVPFNSPKETSASFRDLSYVDSNQPPEYTKHIDNFVKALTAKLEAGHLESFSVGASGGQQIIITATGTISGFITLQTISGAEANCVPF